MAETYAEFRKKQFTKLSEFDHALFDDICAGLELEGWECAGGFSNVTQYMKMIHGDAVIKVYRNAEAPQIIHIAFAASPKEE